MIRRLPLLLAVVLGLEASAALAHGDEALDAILARKRQADISFAQVMQVMHQGAGMIFDGILFENKETVTLGARQLAEHAAPAAGPAAAMAPEKRGEFRGVMPAYDKIFQAAAERVVASAARGQWSDAYAGYREITDACVACHAAWRPYALSRQAPGELQKR